MAEEALTYDPGDASAAIPSHATGSGRKAAVGVCAYLDGSGIATPISLTAGLPVQPGTGTTWTVSDGGGSLTVDGTVAVSGSVAVTGTFWQATQPVSIAATVAVSGPLTDAQLRATAVPVSVGDLSAGDYETVAASQTDQVLGPTGGTGDYLAGLLVVPATTSPGAVSIKDGSGSAVTVFTGGASSVSNLVPFFVALGITSGSGAWKVTTGANVSVVAVGNFA